MSVSCSTLACAIFLLGRLDALAEPSSKGDELEPTADVIADVGPQEVEPGPVAESNAARSERHHHLAVEHADEGRIQSAAIHIIRAYRMLDEEKKFNDNGLLILETAADYNLRAYHEVGDASRLAAIQPLLERFLEDYVGFDPKLEGLRRTLDLIRNERLTLAARHRQRKQYDKAAVEARDCYLAMRVADRKSEIGERAALSASGAYRMSWSRDGDIRHIKAAIAVVDDHLARAGENASFKARQERRHLTGAMGLAQARGGGIEDVDEGSDVGVVTRGDRTFLIASGSALGAGVTLSVGAALVGRMAFERREYVLNEVETVPLGAHIAPAAIMGVAGAVVTGLAVHSMVDAGFIPSRERKIIALSGIALGMLGTAAGATMLAVGRTGESSSARRALSNVGFGLLVGTGSPLAAGIAALASRRGGG